MRSFLLLALVALLSVACSAQSSSSTGTTYTPTFCETYSQIGNSTAQINLIQAVVVRAAVGGTFTAPNTTVYIIPGLFNATLSPLYSIFTGATKYRSGAPDYTVAGSTQQGTLVGHLVGYFGALFGCKASGFTGVNSYAMYTVHQNMSITATMENYFNTQLYLTLLSFGVSASDAAGAGAALGMFNKCGAPIAALGTTPAADGSVATTSPVQVCGSTGCALATGNAAGTATTATCLTYYPSIYASSSSTAGSSGAAGQFTGVALVSAALTAIVALVL